jgi:4-amino-4-deoxy-L-arabinose transferase-like glycosyltransferase
VVKSLLKHKRLDYVLLTFLLGVLFLTSLGNRPLASPDEGRYVEIPREMVETGDYITPHLNSLKYFEKPPFVYWLEAIPLKLNLTSEFFLRLPIALFALIGCLGVYAYATRIYSRTAGYCSAIVLGTSLLYFSLAHIILLDLVLTVLISLGLFSFIIGIKLPAGTERRFHLGITSVTLACAVLTKGLIGIVLPASIIGLWLISLNKWKELLPLYLPTNLFLFALIILPWHLLMASQHPEFFDFYFVREHFERYLTTIHRRMQPWWFFIPIGTLGFFPWIIFLPRAIKNFIPFRLKEWKIYDLEAFLIIWVTFIFLFFSFSSSKLIPYILPIFPPLAIIVGRFLAYILQGEQSTKKEAVGYLVSSAAIVGGAIFFLKGHSDAALALSLAPYIPYIAFYVMGGAIVFFILSFLNKIQWKLAGLLIFHVGFLFTLNTASPLIQKSSMKPFAQYIKENLPAETEVAFYGMYAQDLPFYLGHTVRILNWSGELDAGKELDPQNTIFLSEASFKKWWDTTRSACVVCRKNSVPGIPFSKHHNFKIVYHQDEFVLVCKK